MAYKRNSIYNSAIEAIYVIDEAQRYKTKHEAEYNLVYRTKNLQ